MASLMEQIRQLRTWVKETTPPSYGKAEPKPPVELTNRAIDFSREAAELGRHLLAAAMADRFAYEPAKDPGVQLHPEPLQAALQNPNAKDKNGDPLYALEGNQVQYMTECLKPLDILQHEHEKNGGLGVGGYDMRSYIFPRTPLSRFNEKMQKTLGLDGQLLYRKLACELEAARNNPDKYNTNTPAVQKIERGLQVYAEGRASDAMTILENIRNEDPHNKLISYVLSNIFYHRAAQGNRKFLPQAREEAKKAASQIDKIDPQILERFRYNYIALDGFFSSERQLEVLRSYRPAVPPKADAPAEVHTQFIKSVIFLSLTKAEDWTDKDLRFIHDMAMHYVGGGLLFALFFEKKILPFLFNNNTEISAHFEILRKPLLIIHGAQHNANALREAIAEHFTENVEQIPAAYWTIHRRLMRLIAEKMPVPPLYLFLANTTLDGEHYTPTENLDRILREESLQLGEYWDLWIRKLNYATSVYNPNVLPEALAIREQEILPKAVLILEEIQRQEAKLIDQDKWSICSHLQPKYTYENLAEVGLGHTYTSASFAPETPTLQNYHKLWGAVQPTALLPSEIVAGRANAGGYTDINEVATILEGASKIITDPEYGLAIKQQQAWQEHLRLQNSSDGTKHGHGNFNDLMAEVWWVLLFVFPGALAAFFLVAQSSSMASGARMFIMVIIAFIAFGGFVLIMQKSKTLSEKPKLSTGHTSHKESDDAAEHGEDVSLQDLAKK